MTDETKIFLTVAGIVAFCVGLAITLDSISCNSKWADSGRRHDWSVTGGCRVEDKNGRLIPEKNIRDMQ